MCAQPRSIKLQKLNGIIIYTLKPLLTEALFIEKSVGYADSAKEKVTRSSLKSAVERSLTGDTIVILDSLNYIKVHS